MSTYTRPVMLLLSGLLLLTLAIAVLNTLVPLWLAQEHMSTWQVGVVSSSYFTGNLVGTLLTGYVIKRIGFNRSYYLASFIFAGVVTEVCVAFPALSAIEEGFDVFVVTDASGTFNEITRHSAWDRMSQAGAQLMTWFGVACELHRDWRNDIEGLATLFSNHIPDYRNLMTSYDTLTKQK